MARMLNPETERLLVESAIGCFAERGFWNTPTALVSKTAGVAGGTLFNYFPTKDALLTAVYLDIKRELAAVLLAGIEAYTDVRQKFEYVWRRYIDWGLQHPGRFVVLQQLTQSQELSAESRAQANTLFVAIEQLLHDGIATGQFFDYPVDYVAALFNSHAATTLEFLATQEAPVGDYVEAGFAMFWRGISR
jgi:AcrR family transcriptional regulator